MCKPRFKTNDEIKQDFEDYLMCMHGKEWINADHSTHIKRVLKYFSRIRGSYHNIHGGRIVTMLVRHKKEVQLEQLLGINH